MLHLHCSGVAAAWGAPPGEFYTWISSSRRTGAYLYPEYLASSSLNPTGPAFVLPMWIPLAISIVLACLVVARLASAPRRSAENCVSCAYDLTGITGPCPECGKERQA